MKLITPSSFKGKALLSFPHLCGKMFKHVDSLIFVVIIQIKVINTRLVT